MSETKLTKIIIFYILFAETTVLGKMNRRSRQLNLENCIKQ